MKGTKRWLAVSLIPVLAAGALSGCSSGETKGSTDGGGGSGTVTLKMIESLTSPARTDVIKKMIASFESANPNIKVELISPPLESADNKISTMLAAKEDLDVLEVRDVTVKQFVTNKWIADLTSYTSSWSSYKDLNANSLAMANYIDQKPYYIPYGLYQKMLFYRKDWFDQKGLTPPKTWDDLNKAAKALTDPANNRFGYSFRGGSGADGYIVDLLRDYNGKNVNTDDAMFLKSGATIFSTPEAKQGMQLYVSLYKEGSPKDSVNWAFAEQVQGFVSGATAMLIQDPDTIDPVKQKLKEGTWATAPMPTGPTGASHYKVGAAGWGVTSYSKHPKEAWKLIEFISSPEQNAVFTKVAGVIPIHNSASVDKYFKEGAYKPYIDMANDTAHYIPYKPETDYKGFGEWRKIVQQDAQAVLLGQMSIDDALKKWDAYWINEKKQGK
ncbi:sugar ABC transporter substrate-binding protein [Paenibacillus vulneris]|uniref:ABC transporter substrate-binding protein n=1 Tax=Paenibacillus vulneris TaxID=1133364 RepID=A0ABW3UKJ9_9BACL|nr:MULTISPECIES: sugar ABC transporter substrate-binding protein [unclassified Paenibacillus]MBE1444152.1 multiple sugar transport system substrate-binding protein [Paenibacillus sp. OAS669]